MNWIKFFLKPCIWLYNNTDAADDSVSRQSPKKVRTEINTATGLPMRGVFDTSGNLRGFSSSSWNDYNRTHSSSSNSYNNHF